MADDVLQNVRNKRADLAAEEGGFAVAPILYVLGLIGVGAGVLFSGYSQILRSNQQVTQSLAAKNDLQATAVTLAATAKLGATDNTVLCLPSAGYNTSTNCSDASTPVKATALAAQSQLPANAANAGSAGTPTEVGVFTAGAGVKTLDPWGHYYIYCRWENHLNPGSDPGMMVISAGADGVLNSTCGSASAQGDDFMVSWPVATAVNRSAVWQTVTAGTQTQALFGQTGSQLSVDAVGNLFVPGTLTVVGTSNLTGTVTATAFSGPLTGNVTGNVTGNLTGDVAGNISGDTGAFTTSLSSGGTLTAAGTATLDSLSVTKGATIGQDVTITDGDLTFANTRGVFALDNGGTSRSLMTLNASNNVLFGSTLGTKDFKFYSTGANIATLTSTGDFSVLGSISGGAGSFSSLSAGDTSIGGTLGVSGATSLGTLSAGQTTLSGNLSGTNATFSGTVTAANLSGNIDLSGGGTINWGSVVVPLASGGTGYQATSALDLLGYLGGRNASNINAGTLAYTHLDTSGVSNTGGPYNQVYVDAYGRVTSASYSPVLGDQIIDENNDYVAVSTTGGGQVTIAFGGVVKDVFNSSGWLGLGTTTAHAMLDVYGGNAIIENAEGNSRYTEYATTVSGAPVSRWRIGADSSTETGSGNAGSDFVIQNYDDSGTVISTTTPALTISRATGNATFMGTVTATSFSGSFVGSTYLGSSASATNPQRSGEAGTGLFSPASGVVAVASSGTELMRVTASGVGIGTATPGSKLHVYAGEVQTSTSGGACSATTAGAIRYDSGSLSYCDGLVWSVIGTSSTSSVYIGTQLSSTNPQILGDGSSGLYTPAGSTVSIVTGGVERLRVDSNGYISAGTTVASSLLDIQETRTSVSSGPVALRNGTLNINPASASSTNFFAGIDSATVISAHNTNNVTGEAGYAQNSSSGTISSAIGVQGYAAQNDSGGGVITRGYGTYGLISNFGNIGANIINGIGSAGYAQNASTGTITNAYGVHGQVSNVGGGTVTNAYSVVAELVNSSGNVANWYGLYVPALSGSAPLTSRYPVYVADTGTNYFAGSVGVGTATPGSKLHVYGGEVQTGTSGGACAAGNAGAIRYAGSTLYYCDSATWQTVSTTGTGGINVYLGTQLTDTNPHIQTDATTGLYTPSGSTIGVVTGGVERMRIDSSGNVGIGSQTPGAVLDIAATGTATAAGDSILQRNTYTINPASTSSAGFSAGYDYANLTAAQDTNAVMGRYMEARNSNINTVTKLYGSYNVSNAYAGPATQAVGAYNMALASAGAGSALYGSYNFAQTFSSASANAMGVYSHVSALSGGSITSAYGFYSKIDGKSVDTAYGLYVLQNNSIYQPNNWYGVYVAPVSGLAPTTNRFPLYIADTGPSYFAGSVGIGTSVPASSLDIEKVLPNNGVLMRWKYSDNFLLSLHQTDVNTGTISWKYDLINNGTTYSNRLKFAYTGDVSLANDAVYVTNSGNVGIGTTAPSTLLQVGSYSADNSSAYILFGKRTSASQVNMPFIGQDSIDGTANDLGLGAVSSNGGINFYTGNLGVYFNSANLRMRIDPNGNVGISTTSPASKLHVYGGEVQTGNSSGACSATTAGAIRYTGGTLSYCNSSAWTALTTSGTTNYYFGTSVSATNPSISTDASTGLYTPAGSTIGVVTGGVERMRVNSSGNFGIGTNSPSARLDVQATATATSGTSYLSYNQLTLTPTGTSTGTFYGGYDYANVSSSYSVTGSLIGRKILVQTTSGALSNAYGLKSDLFASGNVITTAYGIYSGYTSNYTTTTWYGVYVAAVSGAAPTNRYPIYVADTGTSYFAGDMGIGTTSPGSKLHVYAGEVQTGTSGSACAAGNAGAIRYTGGYLTFCNSSTWRNIDALGTSLTATNPSISTDLTTGFYTPAGSTIGVVTGGVERMRVNSSGDFGIGTTSPTARLDLQDTATATSGTSYLSYNQLTLTPTGTSTGTFYGGYDYANVSSSYSVTGSLIGRKILVQTTSGALSNAYGLKSDLFASGNVITTAYGIYSGYTSNYTTTTWYGVYVAAVSGAAPTNRYPIYVADTGTSYFAGDMGIGTTSPGSKLHVYAGEVQTGTSGSACAAGNAGAIRYTGGYLTFCNSSTWRNIDALGTSLTATNPSISTDLTTGFYTPAGSTIGVVTGGVERMRVNSSGDFGIGTTSPTARLDLQDTATATSGTSYLSYNQLTLTPTGTSTGTFYGGYDYANVSSSYSVTGSLIGRKILVQTTSGALSNAYGLKSDLFASGNVITTAYGIYSGYTSNYTTTTWYGVYVAAVSGAAPTNRYPIYVADTGTSYFAGDMGIGTTSPGAKLQVYSGEIQTGTSGYACSATLAGSIRYTGGLLTFCDSSSWRGISSLGTSLTATNPSISTDLTTGFYTPAGSTIGVVTGGVERMKIDSAGTVTIGGNVGIGTNSPTARLDVQATATATSGTSYLSYNQLTLTPTGTSTGTFYGGYDYANVSSSYSVTGSLIGRKILVQTTSGALSNAYGLKSDLFASGNVITTAYGIYSGYTSNYTTTTWYGVYVAAVSGAAPTNRYPIYVADTGTSYFAGDMGIGTTSPGAKLQVYSGEIQTGTSGYACSATLAGSIRYTGGLLTFCDSSSWRGISSLGTSLTATNPSISTDLTTGFYTPAGSTIGVVTGGVERMKIDSAGTVTIGGNVGIGTNSPTARLDVQATATATSGTSYLSYNQLTLTPTGTSTGTFYGGYDYANVSSSYSVTGSLIGRKILVQTTSGALSNAYGLKSDLFASGNVITTAYGIYSGYTSNYTTTTWYGVYVAAVSGAAPTNRYPIYVADTGTSYFAGDMGIGTTSPGAKLQVYSGEIQTGTSGYACSATLAGSIRYTAGALSYCNSSAWTALGTAGSTSFYFGTTVTATNPSIAADQSTGFYTPAGSTIGVVTGGVERMRIDSSGNVGIGTATAAARFHAYSSSTGTAATTYINTQSQFDVNASANSSGDFRSGYNSLMLQGSYNYTGAGYSLLSYTAHYGTGTLANGIANYGQVENHTSGTITNAYGEYGYTFNANGGGSITNAWGMTGIVKNFRTAGTGIGTGIGVDALVYNVSTGTIGAAAGTRGWVTNSSTGTITAAYGAQGLITNAAGGTVGTAYGVYSGLDNTSSTTTNWYGVYVAAVTGNAPATNRFPLYIADTGPSYFAGSVGIGTTAPYDKLQITGTSADGIGIRVNNTSAAGTYPYGTIQQNGGTGSSITDWPNSFLIEGAANGGLVLSSLYASMKFQTGGSRTTQMILNTSGSLGIGTATPGSKLHVYAGEVQTGTSGGACSATVAGAIRYTGGTLSYCNASAWTVLTTAASTSNYFGTSLTATNPSISTDLTTGFYTPAGSTIGVVTGGVERMRIDSSGNIGVGTTTISGKLHIYKSDTTSTAGGAYGTITHFDIAPSSSSNTDFRASNNTAAISGSQNLTNSVMAVYGYTNNTNTGTVSTALGASLQLWNNSTGTISAGYGSNNYVINTNNGGAITTAYAANNNINNARSSGVGITTAFGSRNTINNTSTGTITTAYGATGQINNASGGTVGTAYSLYASLDNTGSTTTNWYGVYVATVTGNAPATGRWPLYIADTGPSYFAGNVGIGTNAPGYKLVVSANSSALPSTLATGTIAQFASADAESTRVLVDSFSGSGAGSARIDMRTSRGTAASPSAVQSGDQLGAITWMGYGSTGYTSSAKASIIGYAAENWTDSATGSYLTFYTTTKTTTGNNERMRIDDAGNVSIGTTAAASKLHVYAGEIQTDTSGNACAAGNAGAIRYTGGVLSYCDSATWQTVGTSGADGVSVNLGTQLSSTNPHIQADATTGLYTPAGSAIGVVTGGVERMRIDGSGNVGIGTDAPASKLHVYAGEVQTGTSGAACAAGNAGAIRYTGGALSYCNGSAWASMAVGATGSYLGTTLTAANPSIQADQTTGFYTPAGSTIGVVTGGVERMRIGGSGNVGIGSSSPSATLDIAGTTTSPVGTTAVSLQKNTFTAAPTANTSILYTAGSDVVNMNTNYNNTNWTIGRMSAANHNASSLLWYASGLYGVVYNNSSGSILYASGTYGLVEHNDSAGTIASAYGALNIARNKTSSGTGISRAVGSENDVENTMSGNIGEAFGTRNNIYNTAGGALASATGLYTFLNNTGSTTDTWYGVYVDAVVGNAPTTNRFPLYIADTGTSYFAGNVGIGTTAPMMVNGTDYTSSFRAAHVYSSSLRSSVVLTGVNGGSFTIVDSAASANHKTWTIHASAGDIHIYSLNDAGASTDRMTIDQSGNVGIGTATPASKLHVYAGEVQTGTSGNACAAGNAGAIRYMASVLSYCDGSTWQTLGTSGGGGGGTGYLGTSLTAANPSIQTDQTTGFYTPAGSTIGIVTGGVERMRIGSSGYVGIGTTSAGSPLDLQQTSTATGVTTVATQSNTITINPGSTSSATFEAGYDYANVTTSQNVNAVYGRLGLASNSAGSTITNAYGVGGTVSNTNNGGAISVGYGTYGTAINARSSGVGYTNAYGNAGYVMNLAAGAVTNAFGNIGSVFNAGGGTVTNAYSLYAALDNTGSTTTNWYGVYVAAVTGVAPAANRYPLYVADTGTSYFAGKIAIGTATAQSKLQVYGGEVQTGTSGNACSSSISGAIRYASGVLYYCDNTDTWQTLGAGGGATGYLGTTVTATNPSIQTDQTTGLYTPAGSTIGVVTGGVERMRVDSSGNVGIGSQTPGATLDVAATSTATSVSTAVMQNNTLTANPASTSSATFIAGKDAVNYASNQNGSNITGRVSNATFSGTGTLSGAGAFSADVTNSSSGTISLAIAGGSGVTNSNGGGSITTAYGGYNYIASDTSSGTGFTSAVATRSLANNRANGTITTAYGVQSIVANSASGTIGTAIGVNASLLNTSGTVTNWYGVYVAAVTGNAPVTGRWPLYIADTGPSYFAGSVGIGTTAPYDALHIDGNSSHKLRISNSVSGTNNAQQIYNIAFNQTRSSDDDYASGGTLFVGVSRNGYVGSTADMWNSGSGLLGAAFAAYSGYSADLGAGMSYQGDIRLFTKYNGTTYERLRITPAGSIGIGTATPGSKLHVYAGEVQTGTSGGTCSATVAGAIRYTGGTLSYCNASAWTALGTAGSTSLYLGTTVTATNPSISTDASTGFYTPTGSTIGVVTGGAERVRFDSSGNVGIGSSSPGSKLVVSGTSTSTASTTVNLQANSFTVSPTSASDTVFVAAYEAANLSTNYNTTNWVIAQKGQASHSGTATMSYSLGSEGVSVNNSSGTITNAYGTYGISYNTDNGGTITNAFGAYGGSTNLRSSGVGFTSAKGVIGVVTNSSTGTITSAYGVQGSITNAAGGTVGSAYGLYSSLDNTGSTTTNWYGVYVAAVAGNAPATGRWPLYIADTGPSYFAGNVGIGSASPSSKLDVTGSSTATAAGTVLQLNNNLSIAPASASSSSFYAGYDVANITSNQNVAYVRSHYSSLGHGGTGTLTDAAGTYSFIGNNSSGTITTAQGAFNWVNNTNNGGAITTAFGSYNEARNSRSSGVGVTTAVGSESHVSNSSTGTVTTAYGDKSGIYNNAGGTVTNAYGVYSFLDNTGSTTTNWYGVYVAAVTGNAPATNRFPLYIADTGPSYFAGSVGVGTATPQHTLHVHGSTYSILVSGSGPRISFVDTTTGSVTTNPSWHIDNSGDLFRIFRQPNISTAGSVWMAISSAGLTAMYGDAEIKGGNLNLTNTTSNLIAYSNYGVAAPSFTTRSAGTKILLYSNLSASLTDYALGIESGNMWLSVSAANSSNGFKFYGATTELMRIRGDGLVGIGTTSPASKLHIYAGEVQTGTSGGTCSATTAGAIRYTGGTLSYCNASAWTSLGTAGSTSLYLGTTVAATNPSISTDASTGFYTPTGSTIGVVTGGVERMRFDSSGNAVIGSSVAGAKLDVYQTGGSTGTASALSLRAGNGAGYYGNNQILFGYNGANTYQHAIKTRHHAGQSSTNAIDFYLWNYGTDTSTTVGTKHGMTIDAVGIGIGTTYPAYKLDVQDTSTVTSGTTVNLQNNTLTVNPASSSSGWFQAGADQTTITTSQSVLLARGRQMSLTHSGTGALTYGYGSYSSLLNSNASTISEGYGSYSVINNLGATAAISNAYGTFSSVVNSRATGTGISAAYGSYNAIQNTGGGTLSNAYGVYSSLDNTSSTTTNWYGVYVAPVTGNAPATNRWPLYIADTGSSYFAGDVGVGTTSIGAKFHVYKSDTTSTAGGSYATISVLSINPSSSSNTDFRASNNSVTISGAQNLTNVTEAVYGYVNNTNTSTVSSAMGGTLQAWNNSSGTISNAFGSDNYIRNTDNGGSITVAYGTRNFASNYRSSGTGIGTAWGTKNYVENLSTGTITTAYGTGGQVNNTGGGTVGTAYGVYSSLDNTGSTVTNWYGVYVAAVTGNAPATARYPLYVADTGTSYFAGGVALGTATAQSKLHVYGGEVQTGTSGNACAAGNAGAIRYSSGSLSYCDSATWLTLGGSGYFGTTLTTTSPSINGDKTTGLYTPAGSTIGIVTGGVERMRIDSSGYVGIGTTSASAPLDLQQSSAATSITTIATQSNTITINPVSASSATFEAGYDYANVTASQNVNAVYGRLGLASNGAGGTITNAYGMGGTVSNTNNGGTISIGYGTYGSAINARSSGVGFTNAYGNAGYVMNLAAGTITSAFGNIGTVFNNGGGTVTNAYSLYAALDNTGSATTNWYGVYVAAVTGNAPAANRFPLYIADTGTSYFAGKIAIGTTTAQSKLQVYAGEVQTGTSGNGCAASNAGAIRYTGGILSYCNASTWTTLGASTGSGYLGTTVTATNPSISTDQTTGLYTPAGSTIGVVTGGVERMRFDSLGYASLYVSQLNMSNATSNWINFGNAGVAAPAFTTRSAGTKIVFNNQVAASAVDYAMGVESGSLWSSVPQASSSYSHKFYAGTTEVMTIRGDGNVGIGSQSPANVLDVAQTSTSTAATTVTLHSDVLTANPGSASSSTFRAGYDLANLSASQDASALLGRSSLAENSGAGILGSASGIYGEASNNAAGTIATAYGSYGYAKNANAAGDISTAYGSFGAAVNLRAAGFGISTAFGSAGYVQNLSTGSILAAYGATGRIFNTAGGTISNAYGLYTGLDNTGSTVVNWYGIYVAAVTGNAPATARYPLYIADTGTSYFAGSMAIGTTSAGSDNLKVNGTANFSGTVTAPTVTGLSAPTNPSDAANKAYVDAQAAVQHCRYEVTKGYLNITVPVDIDLYYTMWGGGGGGGGIGVSSSYYGPGGGGGGSSAIAVNGTAAAVANGGAGGDASKLPPAQNGSNGSFATNVGGTAINVTASQTLTVYVGGGGGGGGTYHDGTNPSYLGGGSGGSGYYGGGGGGGCHASGSRCLTLSGGGGGGSSSGGSGGTGYYSGTAGSAQAGGNGGSAYSGYAATGATGLSGGNGTYSGGAGGGYAGGGAFGGNSLRSNGGSAGGNPGYLNSTYGFTSFPMSTGIYSGVGTMHGEGGIGGQGSGYTTTGSGSGGNGGKVILFYTASQCFL